MTGLAIAGTQGAELESRRLSMEIFLEMLAGRSVARLATDIDQRTNTLRAPVTGSPAETDGVALDAVRISVRTAFHQGFESMSMSRFLPDFMGLRMALLA